MTALKTHEFKICRISDEQISQCESWLMGLRRLWNDGLSEFLEHERFCVFRDFLDWDGEIPLHWSYRWEKTDDNKWFPVFYSDIKRKRSHKNQFYCPLPNYKDSWLKFSYRSTFPTKEVKQGIYSGEKAKKTDNRPHKMNLGTKQGVNTNRYKYIPSGFRLGLIASLQVSWDAYKDKKRAIAKTPKFKGFKNPPTSLIDSNNPNVKFNKRWIHIPILGWIKLDASVQERWQERKVKTLKICKKASGWYVQLTGEFEEDFTPTGDDYIGLDVGLKYHYSDSNGNTVDCPKYLRKAEKQLARYQRSLSRMRDTKDEENRTEDSNRYKRQRQKIAKLHEKIARQRSAFNHYHSTVLVRQNEIIVAEDIKIANLKRKNRAKENSDGTGFQRNGQKAKSGLNKSFADAGLGQLLTYTETKAKSVGRKFLKVPPHYTSQNCSNCGETVKKSLSQRTHKCPVCGYITDRDHNAAINILNLGLQVLGLPEIVPDLHRETSTGQPVVNGRGDRHSAIAEPSINQSSPRPRGGSNMNSCTQLSLDIPHCNSSSDFAPMRKTKKRTTSVVRRKPDPEPLQTGLSEGEGHGCGGMVG